MIRDDYRPGGIHIAFPTKSSAWAVARAIIAPAKPVRRRYSLQALDYRRRVYIYDLAVAETHRRQGIATGLIEATRLTDAAQLMP